MTIIRYFKQLSATIDTMFCRAVYPAGKASFEGTNDVEGKDVTVNRKLTTLRTRSPQAFTNQASPPQYLSNPFSKTGGNFVLKRVGLASKKWNESFAGATGGVTLDNAESGTKMYRRYCYTPIKFISDVGSKDPNETNFEAEVNRKQYITNKKIWNNIGAPASASPISVDDRYAVVGEVDENGKRYCVMQREQDSNYPVFQTYIPTGKNAVHYFLRGANSWNTNNTAFGQMHPMLPVKCEYFEIPNTERCETYINVVKQ